jgi:hypothetical protein
MKTIKLHEDDKLSGSYLLICSGKVRHIRGPNNEHLYEISDDQTKLLDERKIRYEVLSRA